ncbi:MAG TPA: PAS domain-containing protein [Burkholderiales bacterium]|nr:PAS domain-containing protein [Burkholderiales bacterium]
MVVAAGREGLFSAIRALRDLVERELHSYGHANPPTDAAHVEQLRALQLGIDELDVMWEQLDAQSHHLAVERERYAELFAFAPDAYVVTDGKGTIREANLAAVDLLYRAGSYLAGKPLAAMVVLRHRKRFRDLLGAIETGTVRCSWRGLIRRGDGEETEVELTIGRLRDGTQLCWLLRPI